MPDVSVVIPTHNRLRLLLQCVGCALDQRGVDHEIIVVDDGSNDGTAEALRSLSDPRIQIIRHDRPRGVAAARNAGAATARGAWIALLDDDDLWAPDKLQRQHQALEDGAYEWVYTGAVGVDASGSLIGGSPPPSPDELLAGLPRRNLMPAGCSNVMVRSVTLAAAGGFDPSLRHLADWDLWLRLAAQGPPACVRAPLVGYRIHTGQATLDTTGMAAEARTLEARYGASRSAIHRWAAWSHLRAGRRLAAAASYAEAVRSGDLLSLGRAAVALLHPAPTSTRRPFARLREDSSWQEGAWAWLAEVRSV